MMRLVQHFAGRPFAIVGVNAGDSADDIRAFMQKVPVTFPIALDESGAALNPWQVFAFPTSYVLDKKGRVRMGLFGSIDWDTPETKARIEALLDEKD